MIKKSKKKKLKLVKTITNYLRAIKDGKMNL